MLRPGDYGTDKPTRSETIERYRAGRVGARASIHDNFNAEEILGAAIAGWGVEVGSAEVAGQGEEADARGDREVEGGDKGGAERAPGVRAGGARRVLW